MVARTLQQQAVVAAQLTPTQPQNKYGLLRPFRHDGARDFTTGSGDDLLKSRVGQVLGSDGTFPWRPELTSYLDRVRNIKQGPALDAFCLQYVSQALTSFLPQVSAVNVSATRVARTLTLVVTCSRVAGSTSGSNQSFDVNVSLPI